MAEETTTQETPESTEQTTDAPAPSDDLKGVVENLSQRFDQFLESQQSQPAPYEQEGSLSEWLAAAPDDDELEDLYPDEQAGAQQEVDPVAQELAGIKEYLIRQDEDKLLGEVNALEEKYPDIREHLPQIAGVLDPIADRLGENAMLYAPLVDMAYRAVKADAASAAETPAEEARNRGASLETEAGAGAGDNEESYEEQAAREIAQAGGGETSLFFGG